MKKYIVIEADINDADYITEFSVITDEDLNLLRPVIEVIKNCKQRPNWPDSDYSNESPYELYEDVLTKEQIDLMRDYIPHGENGIHTIESIKVLTVSEEENLL